MYQRFFASAALMAIAACSSPQAMTQEEAQLLVAEAPIVPDEAPFAAPMLAPPPPLEVPAAPLAVAPEPVAPKHATAPAPRSASVSCEIVTARTPSGLRITPVVKSGRSVSAEYSFVVTKSGGGGSSDSEQGGPVKVRSGEKLSLSSAEFSMERGASYRAVLKVRADGRELCRRVRSS